MSRPLAVLIGPPGAGKTTTGRSLARRLGVNFTDTDEEIARLAGKPVTDIFVEDGEPDPRWLGAAGTAAARAHHARVVRDLPAQAFRLRAGDPAIPTEEGAPA